MNGVTEAVDTFSSAHASQLDERAAKKRKLYELLLKEKKDRLRNQAISRAERTGPTPLSFAQQRLWFIDQLEPGSSLYNIPLALRLSGPLDVAVLQRCLSEVLRRHEVLRTTFRTVAGEPVQEVRPATPFTLPLKDLSGLPVAEREGEAPPAPGRRGAAALRLVAGRDAPGWAAAVGRAGARLLDNLPPHCRGRLVLGESFSAS